MGTPSKVRSRVAGHIQRRVFFCQACGSPFLRRYIPSYASIAAIYRCKKERILFFLAKKYPNACICAIFVVSLQPETNERPYETNPIIGMYDDVPIDCLSASKPDSRRLEDRPTDSITARSPNCWSVTRMRNAPNVKAQTITNPSSD